MSSLELAEVIRAHWWSDDDWRRIDMMERLSQYTVSDRGRAMIEAYKAVKLPVIQWVQP